MLLSIFFLKLFWGLPVNKCEDQRCLNASPEIILSGTVTGATESLNVRTDLTKQAAKIVRHSKNVFKVLVKENEVPTEKNSCRVSIFATKASYISN